MKFMIKHHKGTNTAILVRKGKMPVTMLGALNASIKKWQTIVKYLKSHKGTYVNNGDARTCALCSINHGECDDCPVKYYEGRYAGCWNTPYMRYVDCACNKHVKLLGIAKQEVIFLTKVKKHWLENNASI